jgi:hypothetical protein
MNSINERGSGERGAEGAAVCSDGRDPITAATLKDALRAACAEVGIIDRDVPADGRWHKADIDGDPRGRGDGRIKLFPDGEGGNLWNWKGETRPFFVDDGRKLTEAERRDRERKRAESIRRAREEEARRHAGAARKASEKMTKAPSVGTARRGLGTVARGIACPTLSLKGGRDGQRVPTPPQILSPSTGSCVSYFTCRGRLRCEARHENVCLRNFTLVCIVSLPLVKYRHGRPDVDAFLEAHTIDSAQG